MLHGLFLFNIIGSCVQAIKEATTPIIPDENWADREQMNKDRMNGMSEKEILKNIERGKYKVSCPVKHEEPHRDPKTGKIVIENDDLWQEDLIKYGATQTQRWVEQGKYNLSPEKLKEKREEWAKEMKDLYGIDVHKYDKRKQSNCK